MRSRKEIGIIFQYNEGWIGGTYYCVNLVHALNTLPEIQKPVITILSDKIADFRYMQEATNYPYLNYSPIKPAYNAIEYRINKLYRKLTSKNLIKKYSRFKELVFPVVGQDTGAFRQSQKIYWIPDFQERFLAENFTSEEINARIAFQETVAAAGKYVVFSSNDSKVVFDKAFPKSNTEKFIIPFAVKHPEISHIDTGDLLLKFNLPDRFYFVPNQFWAHKNHLIVLEALKLLKKRGSNLVVAFSGKEHDYRNTEYVGSLKSFVAENNLQNNVRFLGFLDRAEQLKLMWASSGVIQPSRFEGWSTVIEDAKALNKYVIASSLAIHKEQIKNNVSFFDKDDASELADVLLTINQHPPVITQMDYDVNLNKFGKTFADMLESVYSKRNNRPLYTEV